MGDIRVGRVPYVLEPDTRRVVGRPFVPGEDPIDEGQPRLAGIVERLRALSDEEVAAELDDVRRRFAARHRDLDTMLRRNSERVADLIDGVSDDRRLLAGAYLTHECAFEAAALTNPSMVPRRRRQPLRSRSSHLHHRRGNPAAP